jgi:hypothetical protein
VIDCTGGARITSTCSASSSTCWLNERDQWAGARHQWGFGGLALFFAGNSRTIGRRTPHKARNGEFPGGPTVSQLKNRLPQVLFARPFHI